MNREAIDTWLERAILALVLGVLVIGTLAFGGVRPSEFVLLWWLIVAALGLWLVRLWAAPKFRFLWPPVCWAILPFTGYAICRWRTADIEFVARQEILQVVLCVLLFLIVINNLYSQEATRVLCFTLVFLAMFVAMYGVYQWIRSSDSVWGFARPATYYQRASGSFICPNHLAGFLEMVLPLGVAMAVSGRVKVVTRIFLGYASFVCLAGIATTESRAGWLSAGAGMLMLVLMLFRSKGRRWIAVAVLVLAAGAGYWFYERSVARRVAQTYLSGHERDIRLRLWGASLQMWKEHPWIGVGPDHFDYRFGPYRDPVDKTQARPGRVHNDYLNTLADFGLAGLALALLPLGVWLWSLLRAWPHVQRGSNDFGEKRSNRAAIVLGASAGLLALAVHSLFDFNLHIPSNALVAVTLLAVVASHVRFATERHWFTARWPLALGATLVLGGSLYWLVPQAMTRTREVRLLRAAEKLPVGDPEKVALLKRAFVLEPQNPETVLAIGEQLRVRAFVGGPDYEAQTREALPWFERAIVLNKWDPLGYIQAGMCLDWVGRREEAGPYFSRALALDPNHWHARAMMGWHEFQLERYPEALAWMRKSLELNWVNNPMGFTYFRLCERLIAEQNAAAATPP